MALRKDAPRLRQPNLERRLLRQKDVQVVDCCVSKRKCVSVSVSVNVSVYFLESKHNRTKQNGDEGAGSSVPGCA